MDAQANVNAEARPYLQPIAAPSVLGLYGFAGATFIVSAHLAHWYGTSNTPEYLAPFSAMFGGLAQFMAGMWAFKARDTVASALLSMWGSFWLGFGILFTLGAAGVLTIPQSAFPAFGYWFIALGAITAVGAVAATRMNTGLVVILSTVALGCGCFAVGLLVAGEGWKVVAAYLFIIGALAAFYTASAMMLESVGLQILPIGQTRQEKEKAKINAGTGEPGVQQGQ